MSESLTPDPNLPACLAFVRAQEGGYADVKGDRGGPTQAGVTLATYRAWHNDPNATAEQLRSLPAAEWDAIMVAGYYHPCRCQDLPPGVGLQVMDMAVNAGPRASIHILQGVLKVDIDGVVGTNTLTAARAAGRSLIDALNTGQAAYYRSLDNFPQFGRGWLARDARRAAAALAAFNAAPVARQSDTGTEQAVATALDAWRAHPLSSGTAAVPPPPAASVGPAAAVLTGNAKQDRPRMVAVGPVHDPDVALAPPKVERTMVDFSNLASGALKGAVSGAALGPFGMAGGAALGLAVQLVPQLSRWISGDDGKTASDIIGIVQQATGSANPAAQAAAIQDPEVSSNLALQLAQIVAQREEAADAAQVERLKVSMADVSSARQSVVQLAGQHSWMAFAPAMLSAVILLAFGVMIYIVLTRPLSGADNTLSSILLGTLAAMATQVANFWLGSSSGSQRKDAYLAQSFPASMFPQPSAVIPAASAAQNGS